jgi:predicted AlkP superfamily phosphohydrolase/phosphomutase
VSQAMTPPDLGGTDGARRGLLAIIGMDGADLDLLGPWLEEGRLPTLARLYRQGAHGRLRSTIPPMSPEAWSSFATGTNPGKHGVVNFVQPKPDSYELRFCTGALRRGRTFWGLAGEAGYRVGVINVPMTYPPEAVNGFLIAGPDTPGVQADFTYPRELKSDLLAVTGSYDIHGDYWGQVTPREYLHRIVATVESQAQAWEHAASRHQPEVLVAVFGSTDRAQHFLWQYGPGSPTARQEFGEADPLFAVYEAVDRAVARLLSGMGHDLTTFVMSDHGGGPCDRVVYLDRWLQNRGLLTYRGSREGLRRSLLRSAYRLARRHAPRGVKDLLKTRWSGVREQVEGAALRDPIDWERTRAFFLGTESAYLYLNLRGRFPQGTVSPGAEAARVCDQIASGLQQIRDPETGEPVVDSVSRKEEIYHGPPETIRLLPDLVVTWRGSRYVVRRAWAEPAASPGVFVEHGVRTGEAARLMSLAVTGCHRPHGLLLACGPGITPGTKVQNAAIVDLAPTLLQRLGVPIPEDMDGRVLPELARAADAGTPRGATPGAAR